MQPIRIGTYFLTILFMATMTAEAQPVPVDWGQAFALSAQGPNVDPLILLGFNPQPDPPGDAATLNLTDRTQPVLTIPEAAVSGGSMRMLFGISSPYRFAAAGVPVRSMFSFLAEAPVASGLPSLTFELDMNTGSGGVPIPGSWTFFNPQPEPPLLGASPDGLGIDFTFDMTSPATLALRVLEDGANPLVFTLVPEPASAAVMVLGALAFGFRRRALRG